MVRIDLHREGHPSLVAGFGGSLGQFNGLCRDYLCRRRPEWMTRSARPFEQLSTPHRVRMTANVAWVNGRAVTSCSPSRRSTACQGATGVPLTQDDIVEQALRTAFIVAVNRAVDEY